MNLRIICTTLCLYLLCACIKAEKTIDATNEETFKQSTEEIMQSLSAEDREKFTQGLQVLAFSSVDFNEILKGNFNQQSFASQYTQSLDNKTSSEVIAEAEILIGQRKSEERRQALTEIDEIKTKLSNAQSSKDQLAKFHVVRSRHYTQDSKYSLPRAVIELTVKNNTPQAISRVYFDGVLASPDRSVPWAKDQFNYSIPGGIEPGEEATWSLSPNTFSSLGSTKHPEDAVFTATPYRIDDAQGSELYSIDNIDKLSKRLHELQKKYGT